MEILDRLRSQGVAPNSLCVDSRRIERGDVFLAYPGAAADGRRHIADAVAKGAAAVLCEAGDGATDGMTVPAVAVPHLAAMAGAIAHLVYGRPSEKLGLFGVTGTNGKTSVSQWIAQALGDLGRPCAVIGTLGNGFPGALLPSPNTTPEAVTLHRDLARFAAAGAEACAMEVSSIALDQGRTNGACIRVGVFTNLTRDHLEYHRTMEAYAAAKARLFDSPGMVAAVMNLDDELGRALAQSLRGRLRVIGYTLEGRQGGDTRLAAEGLTMDDRGLRFSLDGETVSAPLAGRFNASNVLAVIGALLADGIDLRRAAGAVARLAPPPGRMQRVGGDGVPLVVVDYAHTPDALEKVLAALRETAAARGGRLVCIFGCGGDRDPGKRPLMGRAAERLADRVVLTSDNPRNESPTAIIDAIRAGMASRPDIVEDRAEAIAAAVADADACDTILLAGKGHEPYQEIAGVRHPFSDAAVAAQAVERRR